MRFQSNLESDYQTDLGPEKIRVLKIICTIGSVLFLLFGVIDYWTIPSAYLTVWAIRGIVIFINMAVFVLAIRRPLAVLARYSTCVMGIYGSWGLGIMAMIALAKQNELAWSGYYCGLMLVCSALAISYMSTRQTMTVGLVCVAAYIFFAVCFQGMATGDYLPLLIMNAAFLVGATVSGVLAAGIRERYTRELYLLRHTLYRDIATTKEAKRQSDFFAEHDMLTEMPNRISFMHRLEDLLKHACKAHATVSLIFIDLDDFKPINDQHGHRIGDVVLQVVAERIRSCVRGMDPVARLGGDEFVVAAELDQNFLSATHRLRRNLSAAIASPIQAEGRELSVNASMGIALYPIDAEDAVELLHIADQRMFAIKREGKAKANPPSSFANLLDIGNTLDAADSSLTHSW
jgi:diguanylate cyclase (GGDEF)-like protein